MNEPGAPTVRAGAQEPLPGRAPSVPDYELLRKIGCGAYGEVWLACSKATGALRAAKIVWRHKFEDARPFEREFEGIQKFEGISREHPTQLSLFHIGRNEAEGYFYYVMELADDLGARSNGMSEPRSDASEPKVQHSRTPPLRDPASYFPRTLRADMAEGRLPAERVLEIGLALAETLGYLHSHGLVHRDVKPSNIIFVNGRPKLADIGLVTDASDRCSLAGTEGYLPPDGPGTPQADIFALGKVLYEAITGMDRRRFPDLPADVREWPDQNAVFELNEIILRACAKDPMARYSTCKELHDELAMLQGGRSVQRKRAAQRYWALGKKSGVALSIFAALAAGLVFLLRQPSGRSEASSDGLDSTNQEAKALCNKAMYILRGDNYTEIGTAYTNFQKAIVLDPNFARPYVGLLELRVREDLPIPGLKKATTDELRLIARHLEKLAPHLPATHIAQAAINYSDRRFAEAEQCELAAIKANPNYEFGYTFYSWLLGCYGRPDEALEQLTNSLRLEPSKVIVYRAFGNSYYAKRDYTNAIVWYQKAIDLEQHHFVAWAGLGRSLRAMGDYTNALPKMEKSEILSGADGEATRARYTSLRRALDQDGISGFWTQHLKWAERDANATLYGKASIQMHLGNTNTALELLEASFRNHERGHDYETPLNTLLYYDEWDNLHDNPRFKQLLDEMGLTKVMPQRKK
jgi:serine/threonine protein kinase